MYQAKAAGRNTVCFFDPAMEASVKARAAQEADLHIALKQRQFALHYEAQVGEHKQVIGAEALLRWRHPQQGMVAPGDFISVAEEMGLILPLGLRVLEAACMQLARWAAVPPMASLSIALNVSVHQICHDDFVAQVADAFRVLGLRFALDDFGTGYSSLAYLKLLPLDQLKIDRSFVRDVLVDSNDAAIVRATIALAHSLQLDVIAEAVETQEQARFLADASRAAFQGYLYSRPLPAAEFEQFCRAL